MEYSGGILVRIFVVYGGADVPFIILSSRMAVLCYERERKSERHREIIINKRTIPYLMEGEDLSISQSVNDYAFRVQHVDDLIFD